MIDEDFSVRDYGTAAILELQGMGMADIHFLDERQAVFRFKNKKKCYAIESDYEHGMLMVNAKAHFEQLRSIKWRLQTAREAFVNEQRRNG